MHPAGMRPVLMPAPMPLREDGLTAYQDVSGGFTVAEAGGGCPAANEFAWRRPQRDVLIASGIEDAHRLAGVGNGRSLTSQYQPELGERAVVDIALEGIDSRTWPV
jgi:hypothetical protein